MELEMENGAKTPIIGSGSTSPSNASREQTPPDTTPPPSPKMPTLVDQALAAIAGSGKGRGSLSTGDVAIVFNAAELKTTILLDSMTLARQMPEFAQQHCLDNTMASRAAVKLNGGVRLLFVLERIGGDNGIPALASKALDTAAPAADVIIAPETTTKADAKRVKKEPADNGDGSPEQRQASRQPDTDWARAYECFFRGMMNMPSISVRQVGLPNNATSALPLLEGVLVIAERYECILTVGSAFKSLSNDWISNRTLYAAIAAESARWLTLAVKLESDLVYKEAFVHLVGQHPIFASRSVDRIPEHVMASIVAQARELKMKRYKIDQQLLMTTLRVEKPPGKGKLAPVSEVVGQHHAPMVYNTVNLWRDWLTEHMSYLHAITGSAEDEEAEDVPTMPEATALCVHPERAGSSTTDSRPECLSPAGFYRLLARAGDAYLPAEHVIGSWNRKEYGDDPGAVRANLVVLKARAQEVVGPLLRSRLQLAGGGREGLRYLTCGEVGRVPWAGEEDEREGDVDGDVEMKD
ncbi:hypothetical protein LTR36_005926 [Oleoguttula mirabilis]|uniref:Uncharacterized protein n=1 Tax=Oleoguttula mirabilis TaxID=1507867 RepID=A0AAV9JDA1_9PEZI|nr:hypothetical protein LTR36_005926 [Oleoguttula mirabilis]